MGGNTSADATAVRRFDRAFSQRFRSVTDAYTDPGRALGPSLILLEVAASDGLQGVDLRRRLGLDSAYASRTLRDLEAAGLIAGQLDPADRRRRVLRLTAAGRRLRRTLESRADARVEDLLGPLTASQRAELVTALATAERLLRAATVTFDTVDRDSPDAVAARTAYFAELDERFPAGFDPTAGAAGTTSVEPAGTFVVVRDDDAVVGCGAVVALDADTAELKRMWIHPSWRGLGLGARLLGHLEQVAGTQRHMRVVLDTNGTLTEAIAMYERSGYSPTAAYNDNPYAEHWFAKTLRPRRK